MKHMRLNPKFSVTVCERVAVSDCSLQIQAQQLWNPTGSSRERKGTGKHIPWGLGSRFVEQ